MTPSVPAPIGDEPGVAHDLAELAELAQTLQVEGGRWGDSQAVCELALQVIDADHASITVGDGSAPRVVATAGGLPKVVHRIQSEIWRGTRLTPGESPTTFVSGDVSAEPHWPELATRALAHAGVHSLLSQRLFVRDGEVGFLTAFAGRRDAFSESDVAIFGVFAAHAAAALQAAEEHERADNLEIALRSSRRIGTAIGILMHQHRIDEASAFDLLRRRSQDTNRKLAAIAEEVVRTGLL